MKRQMLLETVRKYTGGGLGDLADRGIPKAQVEIYLRARTGETFYVPTLTDGILHLLSNEGYRLGISYWPDGAGFGKPEYKITIWRYGNKLECDVIAPMLDNVKPSDKIGQLVWNLDYQEKIPDKPGTIEVVNLLTVLGIEEESTPVETQTENSEEFVDRIESELGDPTNPSQQTESSLFEEQIVVIDGTQI